jgi:DNA-directed RNA polymerase alpha subunit
MLNPTPELPDDTPIDQVEFSPRVRDVLVAAGLKTVDEVRETADETLLSFQDLGKASVALFVIRWACSLQTSRPGGRRLTCQLCSVLTF